MSESWFNKVLPNFGSQNQSQQVARIGNSGTWLDRPNPGIQARHKVAVGYSASFHGQATTFPKNPDL